MLLAAGRPAEVVVAGAANVGKSTLLNAIAAATTNQKTGGGAESSTGQRQRRAASRRQQLLTVSATAGTTLRPVHFEQAFGSQPDEGARWLDTPGQINPGHVSVTAKLSLGALARDSLSVDSSEWSTALLLPPPLTLLCVGPPADSRLLAAAKPLRAVVVDLKAGEAVLLGGLAVRPISACVRARGCASRDWDLSFIQRVE